MTVGFYFDEHMARAVADGLTKRDYMVVMAVDVEMKNKDDDTEHLPYATEHRLVMVTFDREFAGRTMSRADHTGLICLSEKMRADVGGQIHILADFSDLHTPDDTAGRVYWLKDSPRK